MIVNTPLQNGRVALTYSAPVKSFNNLFPTCRSTANVIVAMREHLLNNFNHIWIDNLNGDSRVTGKTTPEGPPDPSAFSTPYNKEGIRKGTAVALMVRNSKAAAPGTVVYRDWWEHQND